MVSIARIVILALGLSWLAAAAAEDRFLDGIRYIERGTGTPVVLVHGFTGSIERSWIDTGVLADLARDHRVIALDLRGHGKSDAPHDPAAYERIGADVIALMDHLSLERVHIVGYSLGGIIALKLLTTHPERFVSAVVGAAAYRRSRSERADREADAAAREIETGIYRALVVSTAPTDEPAPTDEVIRIRSAAIPGDRKAHAALMRARRALLVTDADIAAVRVPTLAIVGAADPQLPRVKAMQTVWPALTVEVVPAATHPTVHPRGLPRRPEFLAAIRAWIAK